MRTVLDVSRIAAVVVGLVVVHRLLVRPPLDPGARGYAERSVRNRPNWARRGMTLSVPATLVQLQTATSFNRGSVLSEVPVSSYGRAWPFLGFAAYAVLVPRLAAVGAAIMIMRAARERFPGLGPIGRGDSCVLIMMMANVIVDAVILDPLGFYHLGGGTWPIVNGGRYFGLPFIEVLHFALFFTVPAVIRYFVNDYGETLAERAANVESWSTWRKAGMRGLAVMASVHIGFLAVYHVPVMLYAMNAREHPQERDGPVLSARNTCGERGGPSLPRSIHADPAPGSGYIDWDGKYVPPDDPLCPTSPAR